MRLVVLFLCFGFACCFSPVEEASAPNEPKMDSTTVAEIKILSDSVEIGLKELDNQIEKLDKTIDSLLIGI